MLKVMAKKAITLFFVNFLGAYGVFRISYSKFFISIT